MADSEFDPYYKWFGIPPAEQPPNHYRLLGVDLFESDVDVIESAAEQRMTFLRSHSNGARMLIAQRLLNEVAAAKLCLSHEQRRAEYDERLRSRGVQAAAPVTQDNGGLGISLDVSSTSKSDYARKRQKKQQGSGGLWIWAGIVSAVAVVAIVVLLNRGKQAEGDSGDTNVVEGSTPLKKEKKKQDDGGSKKKVTSKGTSKKKKKAKGNKKLKPLNFGSLSSPNDANEPLAMRGLLAHFPFDHFLGTEISDAVARAGNIRVLGKPQWSIGRVGGAISLNGQTRFFFNLARRSPRSSYSMWLCLKSDEKMTILSQPRPGSNKIHGHRLEVKDGKIACQFAQEFPQAFRVVAAKKIPLNEWHHLAVTFNGGRGVRAIQVYLDGKLWPTLVTHQNLRRMAQPRIPRRWQIGSTKNGAFSGLIDELRIYTFPLPPRLAARIARNRFVTAKTWHTRKTISLRDREPGAVEVSGGTWNQTTEITINGIKPKTYIWAGWDPSTEEPQSLIAFPVKSTDKQLVGAAALTDKSAADSTVTFNITADGKTLWTSSPLKGPGTSQRFKLDLPSGAEKLELKASGSTSATPIWHAARFVE